MIRIPERFQGPTGSGQGGWTASRLVRSIDEPVTIALRAPVPLDVDLTVAEVGRGWQLIDPSGENPVTILEAEPWTPSFASTNAVSIGDAIAARSRFPLAGDRHPVPHCFSCGLQHDSMGVHAGPVGDGRFATDWQVPTWAMEPDGSIDEGVMWAALDCTAAWYACCDGPIRSAFTVQYAVEVIEPLQPDGTYALVGWAGDSEPRWDGRKRGAASAAFDERGACVARARSFWVAVD